MKDTLFVKEKPSVHGFPTDLLPHAVTQVLLDSGFRVIGRMDDRRIWLEVSGLDMNEGTKERPDLGMTHWSLTLETGIFGMHIIRHVLHTNHNPYSGVVYSGKVAQDARFMKSLLAHCISPDSMVTLDEEQLSQDIERDLSDLFGDDTFEVSCNWLPIKHEVVVVVKTSAITPVGFKLPETANIKERVFTLYQDHILKWQPA